MYQKLEYGFDISNVYVLLHDTSDAWFARVRMLQGNQLTWDVFKTEFCREYLTDADTNPTYKEIERAFNFEISAQDHQERLC